MDRVNVVMLEDLKQRITVYIIIIPNDKKKEVGRLIRQIRSNHHEAVTYSSDNRIITDDLKIIDEIKSELSLSGENGTEMELKIWEKNDNLKSYIGEAISQQLRNNFENLIVSNKNDWFRAIDYLKTGEYRSVKLYEGFRFKIIFLELGIGIIIDPKSKFYTDENLRDIYKRDSINSDFFIEKLCPVKDCPQLFNPFATCTHANPMSFHQMNFDNFYNLEEKPSTCTPNLLEYYSDTPGCQEGILGSKILDEPPILTHFHDWDKQGYSYPLELLRKVPSFDDAEDMIEELTKNVILEPDERYARLEGSLTYFESYSKITFPITLGKPLSIQDSFSKYKKFEKPTYWINHVPITTNPYSFIKTSTIIPHKKDCLISVILPKLADDIKEKTKRFFKSFEDWYKCTITFEFIETSTKEFDLNMFNNDSQTKLFLLLKNDNLNEKEILKTLCEKSLKFHTIHLSSILEGQLIKVENIYAPIYHKLFSPFFKTDDLVTFKNYLGFTVQYRGGEILGVLLDYNNEGMIREGFFLKEENQDIFINKFIDLLKDKNGKTLLLINGTFRKEWKDKLFKINSNIISVSDNSLIRMFRMSHENPSKVGVKEGSAIYLDNNWYIIPYNSSQGTQTSIIIKKENISDSDFDKAADICFKMTKFHLGASGNSMKLPFPIHHGTKTINLLKNLEIDELKFEYPLYL